MNKDNAHLYLPLVQALVDGKTIQRRNFDGEWEYSDTLYENEPASRYRIKPEPRELWQLWATHARTGEDVMVSQFSSYEAMKAEVCRHCNVTDNSYKIVHFREVVS